MSCTTSHTPATQATHATPAPAASRHYPDPLAVLERQLLARPGSHGHHHHHRHQTTVNQAAGHLAAPPTSTSTSGAMSRSRTPSPEPTPAARRCMAATEAWMPATEDSQGYSSACPGAIERIERRQSWDGQEYRHAMMVKGTCLVCSCHPSDGHAPKHNWYATHHEINVPPQNIYDADRGFSEGGH